MNLTPEMKEIALRVARESVSPSGASINNYVGDQMVIEFVERFLAALPKPESVGTFYQCSDGSYRPCPEYYEHAEKLYSEAPQDTAAIEQLATLQSKADALVELLIKATIDEWQPGFTNREYDSDEPKENEFRELVLSALAAYKE